MFAKRVVLNLQLLSNIYLTPKSLDFTISLWKEHVWLETALFWCINGLFIHSSH